MTSPRNLLNAMNLRARKEFGQNFLVNPAVADQIAEAAGIGQNDVVLEIGAGLGALTIAAARRAGKLVAVEIDRDLVPLLKGQLAAEGLGNVQGLEQSILKVDLAGLASSAGRPLMVIGNLPYNISSQVLVKLIQDRRSVSGAVLMFQKELAERLCAGPGTRDYGRLSVMIQYCARLTPLRDVRADQFFPRPKVDSAVLRFDFVADPTPAAVDEKLLSRVVQAAFGQRRKTLRNALSSGLPSLSNSALTVDILLSVGIDPARRAETLSVDEFVALSNRLSVIGDR